MLSRAFVTERTRDADALAVARAAGLLRIPEFALFHLAYRRWYGRAADDPLIEAHFVPYLYHRRVPPWVRHLCRDVLGRAEQGRVDPRAYGVRPVLPPLPDPRAERWRAVFLALVYGLCFALVTAAAL